MIHFGTGGWRAIIGDDFIRSNIELVCAALVAKMRREGVEQEGVVIGFDRRFLSDDAARWCAGTFAAYGVPVKIIEKPAPTPLIMYAVRTGGEPYGLAVTASHNPASYNGIKVFTRGGRDAAREVTDELENEIAAISGTPLRVEYEEGVEKGLIRTIDPFNSYIDSILAMIDVESIKERHLNVLLDPMHGVSRTCLQTVLLTCRCSIDVINDRHDTLFGGHLPSPSSATLHKLADMVVERGYDIGIATDGDADRLGIIDEKGNFIHPNDILVLLYYYLLQYKGWKGPVVRNIATTHLLDRIAEDFGQICYEVPVGFKWISAKMDETGAVIGGESSGGLTVKGHIDGKDGIFAASILVEMICRTGKSLHTMLADIRSRYGDPKTVETNFRLSAEEKDRLQTRLFQNRELPPYTDEIDRISYLDGLKVYFKNDGWIICRFSGTEPLLRIYSEMPDEASAQRVIGDTTSFLGIRTDKDFVG